MEQSPKQTTPPTEQPTIESGDPSEGNPFVSGAGIPIQPENSGFSMSEAAQKAQGFENTDAQTVATADPDKGWSTTAKVAAGFAAGAALVAGGVGVSNALAAPEFSQTTTEYVVQPGDGLYQAAEQIDGINSVDIRDAVEHISTDPANIDVLKDGLQPGEIIEIPTEVQQ